MGRTNINPVAHTHTTHTNSPMVPSFRKHVFVLYYTCVYLFSSKQKLSQQKERLNVTGNKMYINVKIRKRLKKRGKTTILQKNR